MLKKFFAFFGVVGASAMAFAEGAATTTGLTIDAKNAGTVVDGVSDSIKNFAQDKLFPAILVILGVVVSIVLAMWAYRQIRKWMSAR